MTESMSILAAPTTQMGDHPLLMFLSVLLFIGPIVSVAIGKMIGVFRHPGIVGPDRLGETESPLGLFGMLLFAIVGYILVSGLYARAVAGDESQSIPPPPTTQQTPATGPATQSITTATPPVSASGGISTRDLVMISAAAGCAAALILVLGNVLMRPGGVTRLGLHPRGVGAAVIPAIIGFVFVIPLMYWVGLASKLLWDALKLEHDAKHELLKELDSADPVLAWMIVVSAVVLAPLYEEILFRGHLQTALSGVFRRKGRNGSGGQGFPVMPLTEGVASEPVGALSLRGPGAVESEPTDDFRAERRARWLAVVIASLLFALVHPWWTVPSIFSLSLCLGFVYERTGNLYVPILLHALFNGSSIVLSRFVMQQ